MVSPWLSANEKSNGKRNGGSDKKCKGDGFFGSEKKARTKRKWFNLTKPFDKSQEIKKNLTHIVCTLLSIEVNWRQLTMKYSDWLAAINRCVQLSVSRIKAKHYYGTTMRSLAHQPHQNDESENLQTVKEMNARQHNEQLAVLNFSFWNNELSRITTQARTAK